ncbi:hypothetical protein CT0861_03898 [Colletotrichum tofieldiae]|uniref:Uncharacterized protein n=1 Tax=Colletotrichum tofieldiae TaxID=708197 RepID=A0A166RF33_9PEZI|nr:hypothetical protein CT0861_03898 [Colletotrichum tofieldiae]
MHHADRVEVYESVRRHQTNIIFGAVWDARAQMAVQSGQVESEADFRPTRAEASEMFLDAFNISANVPSAGSSQGTEPPLIQTPIPYNPKPPSEGSGACYPVGASTDLAEPLMPDTSRVDTDQEETLIGVGGWEGDIDPYGKSSSPLIL